MLSYPSIQTAAGGAISGVRVLAGGVTEISAATGPTIEGLYSQYVYRPGTKFWWKPNQGANANGSVTIGWLDNAEAISKFANADYNGRSAIIYALGNSVTHQITKEFSYALPNAPRRRVFDVNRDVNSLSPIDELERSAQGALIYVADGAAATSYIGRVTLEACVHLEGLSLSSLS